MAIIHITLRTKSEETVKRIVSLASLSEVNEVRAKLFGIVSGSIDDSIAAETIEKLKADPDVKNVEPDSVMHAIKKK